MTHDLWFFDTIPKTTCVKISPRIPPVNHLEIPTYARCTKPPVKGDGNMCLDEMQDVDETE